MLLPPTSALPISQHCLAERPALHSVRRARPKRPCPATASRGRSWRQPALSTGSSCSARCSPPNQRYNWIANNSFPKKTHQNVRLEEAAAIQTPYSWTTSIVHFLMHISRLESMECITTWGKGGTPKTQFRGNRNVPKNYKQKLAIHEDLWLSVGLHKRTCCCHSQWKCYRQLKSICAANHRDQCHRHQLLDYLHPNVPTCAVWRLQCIWQYAIVCSILFEKRFDNWACIARSKLKTGSGPMHEHSTYIINHISIS